MLETTIVFRENSWLKSFFTYCSNASSTHQWNMIIWNQLLIQDYLCIFAFLEGIFFFFPERNDTHPHRSMLSSSTSLRRFSSVIYPRSRSFQMTTIQSNCSFLPAIHTFFLRICMIFFCFSLALPPLEEKNEQNLRVCIHAHKRKITDRQTFVADVISLNSRKFDRKAINTMTRARERNVCLGAMNLIEESFSILNEIKMWSLLTMFEEEEKINDDLITLRFLFFEQQQFSFWFLRGFLFLPSPLSLFLFRNSPRMTLVIVTRTVLLRSTSIYSFAFALSEEERERGRRQLNKSKHIVNKPLDKIHRLMPSDLLTERGREREQENAKFIPEEFIRSLEIYLGGTIGSYFLC